MKAIVDKYYPAALDVLPEPRQREFQKRLLALTARANALQYGDDEPMDREALADLGYDLGDWLSLPPGELQGLLEDVFDESGAPLSALLDEVRADAWPPRAQEALYACPYSVTLRLVADAEWDELEPELMREWTGRFLDELARALALTPAARERIESAARALQDSGEDAED